MNVIPTSGQWYIDGTDGVTRTVAAWHVEGRILTPMVAASGGGQCFPLSDGKLWCAHDIVTPPK